MGFHDMRTFGTVSYNMHCSFTNYGSALQSWALGRAIARLGHRPVMLDYCPDVLRGRTPLDPFAHMWDQDEESRRMCELTLPAIRVNCAKFEAFYRGRCNVSAGAYTSENFCECVGREGLDGFVCGSDTIFCIDEFKGFDDGYYANYPCMRGRSVAYAASFGDVHFAPSDYPVLDARLANFKAIGLRESQMLPYVKAHTAVPCARVVDPTLLLSREDYDAIAAPAAPHAPYLLLYTRRYNPAMEAFAIREARERGLAVVEISLRAVNAALGHEMRYDAGVEEFLALVRDAALVVTNSFHGLIFAVQYSRPCFVFSREQGDTKIGEVLELFGMEGCLLRSDDRPPAGPPDYAQVHARIAAARKESYAFLRAELELP